ncbi:CotS family spore coat protein [Clostridium sardiniense]|uniref:CotS family spore coat protein n=1 Tax=Clostridium sardiniense TaxID=29369 RepID=A0ABS7KY11_CLOSR|nr:CotS family spore coat protein [Clostridium sardiniense]MBM7835351.1 CotS family spore coat protein [Clostridium sardiniense]MBY0755710.1 CotS family spore coat protein [Clostridium sardiniense]MDQ0460063.1 CotS family spore coat protein [Clostridium sardiniense]
MRKVKYGDKKLLCRYDLSKNFFDKLGLDILDITPLRKLYILNTTEGKKILKKVDYNEERIKFIGESLEYVNKNFPYIMKMNKLQANDNYISWQGDNYIVMDLIEGREASISNPIEVEMCSEALARMHKASQMISDVLEPKEIAIKKSNNLVEYYKSIKEDLINIKDWVSCYTYKNEFDKLFIENCDRYIEEISKVNEMIWVSKYRDLLMDKELICLCHNDLANHNFIINENKINIIDFDYSTIDLRTLDIADFLLKWIKNSVFDINKGKLALESYDKIFKIKDEEYKLIYILMSFPRDIYSIIKSYYHKSKEWEEEVFLHRFKTKLENDVFRIKFLDDYKKFYEDKIL